MLQVNAVITDEQNNQVLVNVTGTEEVEIIVTKAERQQKMTLTWAEAAALRGLLDFAEDNCI